MKPLQVYLQTLQHWDRFVPVLSGDDRQVLGTDAFAAASYVPVKRCRGVGFQPDLARTKADLAEGGSSSPKIGKRFRAPQGFASTIMLGAFSHHDIRYDLSSRMIFKRCSRLLVSLQGLGGKKEDLSKNND